MQLWTWQNQAFDLADRKHRVESLAHSVYITDSRLDNHGYDRRRHQRAYEKIFERLGTDQLVWCFHRYEDAVDSASISEF